MIPAEEIRDLLRIHGHLREQPASEWSGDITLPEPIARFYQEIGPDSITISAHGNPYFFPRLSELWDFQAGYRWNGLTKERIPDWDEDWIVVADEGGDPFIYSCENEIILLAAHGTGSWKPYKVFANLNALAACLGTIGKVVREAGSDFLDDDFMIEDRYIEKISNEITQVLGSSSEAASVLWNLGYLQTKPPHCE